MIYNNLIIIKYHNNIFEILYFKYLENNNIISIFSFYLIRFKFRKLKNIF